MITAARLRISAIAATCALSSTTARAWDFSYSYTTVNDANALAYVVGQQNVARYNDWTGSSYWGPTLNDGLATLTSRFTFSGPTAEVFLHARLESYNWTGSGRPDYGFSSLWASTDGSSWQLLLDCPTPSSSTGFFNAVYNQDIPSSLLGSSELWLQARMEQHAAFIFDPSDAAAWTDAQFSRFDGPGVNPPSTGNAFELNATLVPEPTVARLALLATGLLCWRLRRSIGPDLS